jgi:hypothetical protein
MAIQYRTCVWRAELSTTTNRGSEYAIFISFPWQKWLRERALMLRHA